MREMQAAIAVARHFEAFPAGKSSGPAKTLAIELKQETVRINNL